MSDADANPAVPAGYEREVLADLGRFTHDPLGFVLYAFPWSEPGTVLEDEDGPDVWQREQLQAIGASLRENPHQLIQDATASGHGIGKGAEVAWLVLWALMTHEDARGVVTANTEGQLRTKTWPELHKWYGLLQFPVLRQLFAIEATSIHSTQPGHERTWRVDAVAWSERNVEAFAGLHNAGKRTILLFDEASSIPAAIWDTAAGALSDAKTELLWLAYGNPTRNSGRFKEVIAGRFRSHWSHRQIDSRTVKRTSKEQIEAWRQAYGEDSDFFRVRVLGQFPRASSVQFIGSDVVQAARRRELPAGLPTDPLIFGLDCARFGDDHSTLAIRRGRDARSIPWSRWSQQDAMKLAGDVALEAERWKPDAIFVDAGNIGAAVVDRLRQMMKGHAVYEVQFGGRGGEAIWHGEQRVKTMNKRAEIWTTMRSWLHLGCIPDDDDLEADLTGVEYGYGPDQTSIQLEKKEHMRSRGLASPDDADALACTFAEYVQPRQPDGLPNTYLPPAVTAMGRWERNVLGDWRLVANGIGNRLDEIWS